MTLDELRLKLQSRLNTLRALGMGLIPGELDSIERQHLMGRIAELKRIIGQIRQEEK